MFSHCRSIFDETLALTYKDLKKAQLSLAAFWNIHGGNGALVVASEDVQQLLTATGSWENYEAELSRVCSTKLGKAMCEWANAKVVDDKVDGIMQTLSVKFDDVPCLTAKFGTEACTEARQKIADLPNLVLLGQKRTVKILYRGRVCPHAVTTTEEEIQLRLSSAAKGRACQAGQLVEITFEPDLVDGYKLKHVGLELELVKGAAEARVAANNFIHLESEHADGQLASKVLAIKEKTLSTIDRNIGVEIAFISAMAGGTGQSMLMQKVADTLPTPAKPRTPQDTLTLLGALFSSSLFAFPSKQAQQSAALIRAAVTNIHMKRRPVPLDPKCGNDVRACYHQMSNFCTHEFTDKAGTKVVYGKEAIDLIHAIVEEKAESDDDLTLADLSYGRFHWLLSQEQVEQLKKFTRQLVPSWDGDLGDADDEQKDEMAKKRKLKLQEASVNQAVDDAFA